MIWPPRNVRPWLGLNEDYWDKDHIVNSISPSDHLQNYKLQIYFSEDTLLKYVYK